MNYLALSQKISAVVCAGCLSLGLTIASATAATTPLDRTVNKTSNCQIDRSCPHSHPGDRQRIASNAKLQFIWNTAPLQTASLILESLVDGKIIALAMLNAAGYDLYIIKVRLTNTGDIPLRIYPQNITAYYSDRAFTAVQFDDNRFLQADVLQPNYKIDTLAAFIAPKDLSLNDFKVGYRDNTIEVE
jgi:hypothetical protein